MFQLLRTTTRHQSDNRFTGKAIYTYELVECFILERTIVNSIYQRISGILHWIVIPGIKVNFKRENHEHTIHQPLDFLHPARVPRPNLRGYIIEYGNTRFLDKFSHPEIKTTVIHKNHDIRSPCQNILVTGFNIRLNLVQIFQNRQEPHDGRVLVMANDLTPGLPHQITSPPANFRTRVKFSQSLDQIRGMQIARCLSRNNVVFHWLFSILWAKIEKDLEPIYKFTVPIGIPVTNSPYTGKAYWLILKKVDLSNK